MKNKKKLYIIGGCIICVILTVVLCFILMSRQSEEIPPEPKANESTTNPVVIDEPVKDTQSTEPISKATDKIEDDGTGLKPVVETDDKSSNSKTTGEKIGDTAKPIEVVNPNVTNNDDVGITIPGIQPPPYSCGVEGHNCYNAETHAYILNLELEGCRTCGSHSCPSFYAKNQWGYTGYNPEKCPQYDVLKDPLYYCQKCHKKTGDGTNGTCAEYNADVQCPSCKEQVKAWTCHTCK